MPGHRRGRRGGGRPAPGHTEARTSGDEPVAQLPVPGTAASCGDADGAAHAQQYGAGVGGCRHGDDRSGGPADDGGTDECFVDIDIHIHIDINVYIDARGDVDAVMAGG
ncbi:hypothetical protein ACFVUQ_08770 [Streptomyces cyaneofuscatus]|uniref:hypothetical protein n=1 Tax=Streptomyces cyaneofuscatus TaxID=66883 RepID=UPI0036DC4D7A